jgi:adenylate kinase family enzyme
MGTRIGLVNIGPLNNVQMDLQKTVLYGPNGTGKTTVARALGFTIKLLRGETVSVKEALALISRKAETGKIVLDDYEIELARRWGAVAVKIAKAGEILHQSEASDVILTYLDERPSVDVLIRVRLGDVVVVDRVVKTLPLSKLASPSIVTQWGAKWESAEGMDEYTEYMREVNDILSDIKHHELVAVNNRLYYRSNGMHFGGEDTAAGVQRMAAIIAAYVLAKKLLERRGVSPLLFIENLEASLYLDNIVAALRFLTNSEIPVAVETSSGIVLRTAVLKQLNYYIFVDGTVTMDLKTLEPLWREVQILAELT